MQNEILLLFLIAETENPSTPIGNIVTIVLLMVSVALDLPSPRQARTDLLEIFDRVNALVC